MPRAATRPAVIGLGVLALIGAGSAWYAWGGLEKFAGFAAGLAFGLLLVAIGRFFLKRQRRASGAELVQNVMMGSLFSFVLLGGVVIVVSSLWKAGVRPFALTALPVYLAVKFAEVAALSKTGRDC